METSQATIELDHRSDQALIRVAIIDERSVVANELVKRLTIRNDGQLHDENAASVVCRKIEADTLKDLDIQDVIIFSPLTTVRKRLGRESLLPNVEYAKSTIKAARTAAVRHFVLLSSAEVYGSDYSNPGMVTEDRSSIQKRSNRIADAWSEIESYASGMIADNQHRLSIVRPCFVLNGDTREFASRLFSSWFAFPFAGYDPCMQLLSLEDFATAICRIIRNGASGEFNVAPNEVVSLRNALRRARIWRIPIPHCVQRCLRALMALLGVAESMEQLEYLRFPWTVSSRKLRKEVDFVPIDSSLSAIRKFRKIRHFSLIATDRFQCSDLEPTDLQALPAESSSIGDSLALRSEAEPREQWVPRHSPGTRNFTRGVSREVSKMPSRDTLQSQLVSDECIDEFGMSEKYIHSCSRWQFRFMEKYYWRIEIKGLENIPSMCGAVLAGIHRGFMPFDGVMLVHLLSSRVGRIPRFLIHPGLVKPPHLSGFLTRIGGIIACQENADRILEQREILGVFPEGIRGAFRMYDRDVYKIGKHRFDYIKTALRHRVPIVPFVTIGPAESFPILGKIESSWWKKHTHWPFIPITPTGNLFPLPTKWHFQILKPIPTEHFSENSADDKSLVQDLGLQIQHTMQMAINEMLIRRPSIFWGTVFDHPPRDSCEAKGGRKTVPSISCDQELP